MGTSRDGSWGNKWKMHGDKRPISKDENALGNKEGAWE